MPEQSDVDALASHLNQIIRALLVAGRQGAPAEGLLPFNPLYFNILRVLAGAGSIRPSHIADELAVPRTTISTAVKTLINKNLIKTSKDPNDKRALQLSLTQEGQQVLEAILRQDKRNATAMLQALSPDEQRHFLHSTDKIATALGAANRQR